MLSHPEAWHDRVTGHADWIVSKSVLTVMPYVRALFCCTIDGGYEMSEERPAYDVDVFDNDFFAEDDEGEYRTIGKWGKLIFHILKLAFVLYSGAHNVNASVTAAGNSFFAAISQVVGVLVLEATIGAMDSGSDATSIRRDSVNDALIKNHARGEN